MDAQYTCVEGRREGTHVISEDDVLNGGSVAPLQQGGSSAAPTDLNQSTLPSPFPLRALRWGLGRGLRERKGQKLES